MFFPAASVVVCLRTIKLRLELLLEQKPTCLFTAVPVLWRNGRDRRVPPREASQTFVSTAFI